MDAAEVLMGDCLKYVNDLGGDGLDDSMMYVMLGNIVGNK